MFLPKDSFRARILNRKALGWLNFAHRAAACKRGPDQSCGQQRDGIWRREIWRFGSRFLRFGGAALVAAQ
jgi:hypothetical protein